MCTTGVVARLKGNLMSLNGCEVIVSLIQRLSVPKITLILHGNGNI